MSSPSSNSQQLQRAVAAERVNSRPSRQRSSGGSARWSAGDRRQRTQDAQRHAAGIAVGARIRRRDRAYQVVHRARAAAPVDGAVACGAAAEIAASLQILRPVRARCRRSGPAGAMQRQFGRDRHLAKHLERGVIRQDRHRLCATIRRRRAWRPWRAASRRSRCSPCSTAQLTGARPRYLGSSEPCML